MPFQDELEKNRADSPRSPLKVTAISIFQNFWVDTSLNNWNVYISVWFTIDIKRIEKFKKKKFFFFFFFFFFPDQLTQLKAGHLWTMKHFLLPKVWSNYTSSNRLWIWRDIVILSLECQLYSAHYIWLSVIWSLCKDWITLQTLHCDIALPNCLEDLNTYNDWNINVKFLSDK